MKRLALLVACPLALALSPAPALADMTKDQCIQANAQGQELRNGGKLAAAREQLRACASPACPALVRDDCNRRLDDLDKIQPTVVFVAKDASGADVADVAVTIDGKPLASRLDGAELPVDPGEHVFTFAAPGRPPVTKTLVLAVGEKDRREEVVVGSAAPPAPAAPAPAPPVPAPVPPAPAPALAPKARLVVDTIDGASIALDGRLVATSRLDSSEEPGPHELRVTAPGMQAYQAEVDLRDGETRTLEVSLEAERHAALWPWIAGGAAVVAGAVVGGYFLLKPQPSSSSSPALPPSQLGSLQLRVLR